MVWIRFAAHAIGPHAAESTRRGDARISTTISFAKAQKDLRKSIGSGAPPVLVVGSGLLKHLRFGPFADWNTLMLEVACELGVAHDLDLARAYPTLFWESLLAQAAQKLDKPASELEERAQRHVRDLVRAAEDRLQDEALQRLARSSRLRSVITLNFTAAPFIGRPDGDFRLRPIPHLEHDGGLVWCPHGSERAPRSICLGARKYAQLIDKLEVLRGKHRMMMMGRGTDAEPNFMSHVLDSPMLFAGCGLQSSEWTLWWLLATKARNEARKPVCPSIYLTGKAPDDIHARALGSMNCKVLQVDGHSEVWSTLTRLLQR